MPHTPTYNTYAEFKHNFHFYVTLYMGHTLQSMVHITLINATIQLVKQCLFMTGSLYIICIVACLMRKWDGCVLLVKLLCIACFSYECSKHEARSKEKKEEIDGKLKELSSTLADCKGNNSVNMSHSVLIWLYSQVV